MVFIENISNITNSLICDYSYCQREIVNVLNRNQLLNFNWFGIMAMWFVLEFAKGIIVPFALKRINKWPDSDKKTTYIKYTNNLVEDSEFILIMLSTIAFGITLFLKLGITSI